MGLSGGMEIVVTRRGWAFAGARERISPPTWLNSSLETIAGKASSTHTGGALSFALVPQINVPVYTFRSSNHSAEGGTLGLEHRAYQ